MIYDEIVSSQNKWFLVVLFYTITVMIISLELLDSTFNYKSIYIKFVL
jgi:hypothetical protein